MTPDELQSKTISLLRFPLIVGVVFIHAYMPSLPATASSIGASRTVCLLFSDILPRVAVPLFFFISGFLFFYKTTLTRAAYKRKFINRGRSLLLPYLLWNILLIGIYCIETSLYSSRSVTDVIRSFGSGDYYRVACQMWFLRDLIFMVLLTPVIEAAVRLLKFYWLAGLAVVWYFHLWPFGWGVHFPETAFFFSCGAYFSLNRLNLNRMFPRKYLFVFLILYLLLVIADVWSTNLFYQPYIRHADILVGCALTFCVAGMQAAKHPFVGMPAERNSLAGATGERNPFVGMPAKKKQNGKVETKKQFSIINFLAEASFFVFAVHVVLLRDFDRILNPLPRNETEAILIYFFVPSLAIAFSLLLYMLCRKFLPWITAILMGRR